MAMAGLTADASKKINSNYIIKISIGVLCKYMRTECLNYKYLYASNHPLNRLVTKVADSIFYIIK